MTHVARTILLQALAAAVLAAAGPARAEGNRLLPFWSQPYPYGYAWRDAEPPARADRSCIEEARPDGRRGTGRYAGRRCTVVLHARD